MRKSLVPLMIVTCGVWAGSENLATGANPTAKDALRFKPVQSDIEYDIPASATVASCTINAEKDKRRTGWVVRDPNGRILRRFVDTNGDNVVDQWSYYFNGLEVYRDIDANFNGKADQHRWFHTGGTRWAIDRNEDGKIDGWRAISAEEVAEEAVRALRDRDRLAFESILLTTKEADTLGLGDEQLKQLKERIGQARSKFRTAAAKTSDVTRTTKYVDFGGTRPGIIPAGTEGSTKDVLCYENVGALVETDGKHAQLSLGTLIQVGNVWKLVDLPGETAEVSANRGQYLAPPGGSLADTAASPLSTGGPTEAEQKQMAELEQLDRQIISAAGKQRIALNDRRAEVLEALIKSASSDLQKSQWIRQMSDTLSAEVQSGGYPDGYSRLVALRDQLVKGKADLDLVAAVEYRTLAAEYGLALSRAKDITKVQEKRLADLEGFVRKYPKCLDAADALLELGMAQEFAGDVDKALQWYQSAAKSFAGTPQAKKAAGAARRLDSVGKPLVLRGKNLSGGNVDLAEYRGKVVVIQYWATWCEPCKTDIARLKELYAKYAKSGFDVIGINLDNRQAEVEDYLQENRLPWQQMYEPGGLDSRLAYELGVLTLPTMLLIDDEGKVLSRSIHIAELSGELRTLLKK